MDLAEEDREGQARVAAFRDGMRSLGWIEGRNVTYDYRWTAGNPAVMERYAPELLALKPEVIMNGGLPTLVVMQRQTRTIPIVFAGPRSRRSGICREPRASRRKHYWICQLRIFDGWKMARNAHADRASLHTYRWGPRSRVAFRNGYVGCDPGRHARVLDAVHRHWRTRRGGF